MAHAFPDFLVPDPSAGASTGSLLAEDGGALLAEDGGLLLLEGGPAETPDIRKTIRARLLDWPAFLATEAPVRPAFRPQADPLPCVVYRVLDEEDGQLLEGPNRVATCDVEVAVIAADPGDAVPVAAAIRGALHGWRGSAAGLFVVRAKQTRMRDGGSFMAEGSDDAYHLLILDYRLRYRHD